MSGKSCLVLKPRQAVRSQIFEENVPQSHYFSSIILNYIINYHPYTPEESIVIIPHSGKHSFKRGPERKPQQFQRQIEKISPNQ